MTTTLRFKVGDRVTVLDTDDDPEWAGRTATIIGFAGQIWDYEIRGDKGEEDVCYVDDYELAPAPQPAAPVQGATAPTPNEARGQLSDDDTITYIRQRFAKRMDGSSGMSWDHEEIQALLGEIDALRAKLPAAPVAAPEPTSATPTFNSHGSQRPDDYTSNAVTVRAVGSAEHELSYPEPETSTAPVTTATKLERGQKATYTYMNNHKKVKSACLVYSVYRLSAEILLVSDITGLVQQRSVRLSSLTPRDNTLGFIDAKLQHEYER